MKSSNILPVVWDTWDTERRSLHQKGLQFSCFIVFFVLDIQKNRYFKIASMTSIQHLTLLQCTNED